MAVGLPAKASLEADIFWTVYKSITVHGSYVGNRQDAIECVNIAATGAVRVHYVKKHINDLAECVFVSFLFFHSIYAYGIRAEFTLQWEKERSPVELSYLSIERIV